VVIAAVAIHFALGGKQVVQVVVGGFKGGINLLATLPAR
jgi:hypothetical protein